MKACDDDRNWHPASQHKSKRISVHEQWFICKLLPAVNQQHASYWQTQYKIQVKCDLKQEITMHKWATNAL
jgi:hypothetical protein